MMHFVCTVAMSPASSFIIASSGVFPCTLSTNKAYNNNDMGLSCPNLDRLHTRSPLPSFDSEFN